MREINMPFEKMQKSYLEKLSHADLIRIVEFQNKKIEDNLSQLRTVNDIVHRIFKMKIIPDSQLKLDFCNYYFGRLGGYYAIKKTKKDLGLEDYEQETGEEQSYNH